MSASDARKAFEEASNLYRAGNYEGALVLLESLAQAYPSNKDLMFARARVYAALGRNNEAIELCDQVESSFADDRVSKLRAQLASAVDHPQNSVSGGRKRGLMLAAALGVVVLAIGVSLFIYRGASTPAPQPQAAPTAPPAPPVAAPAENRPILTVPADTELAVRTVPGTAPAISLPGEELTFITKNLSVSLVQVSAQPPIQAGGTLTAPPGGEFTLRLKVHYQVQSDIAGIAKLAANIEPDFEPVHEQANRLGKPDLYNLTVHFDTQTRPGYADVKGEGELEFTLTSWAPLQPGSYAKKITIGLFDDRSWEEFYRIAYALTVVVR